MNKLQVVNSVRPVSQKQALLNSLKKTQEQLWESCFYGEQISFIKERYFEKITSALPPSKNRGIDIGCGCGYYSERFFQSGKEVYACDIAKNAAVFNKKILPSDHVSTQALPYLQEEDSSYDFALVLDVVPELPKQLHRLAISEVARILKKGGSAFFSTRLDRISPDSLEKFIALIGTEFVIQKVELLHLRYWHFLHKAFPKWKDATLFEKVCKKLMPQSSYSDVLVFVEKKNLV